MDYESKKDFKKFSELKQGESVYLAIFDNSKHQYDIKKIVPTQVMNNQEYLAWQTETYPHMSNELNKFWDDYVFLYFKDYAYDVKGSRWDGIVQVEKDMSWSEEHWDFTVGTHRTSRYCNICTTLEEAEAIVRTEMDNVTKHALEEIKHANQMITDIETASQALVYTINIIKKDDDL